jgi:hypothetical protein
VISFDADMIGFPWIVGRHEEERRLEEVTRPGPEFEANEIGSRRRSRLPELLERQSIGITGPPHGLVP